MEVIWSIFLAGILKTQRFIHTVYLLPFYLSLYFHRCYQPLPIQAEVKGVHEIFCMDGKYCLRRFVFF